MVNLIFQEENQLLISGSVVVWSRTLSLCSVKQFTCECAPLDACFLPHVNNGKIEYAVAILVFPSLLRIFDTNGESYDKVLHYSAIRLHSLSTGLLIERDISNTFSIKYDSRYSQCRFYSLIQPRAIFHPVHYLPIGESSSNDSYSLTLNDPSLSILCVKGNMLFMQNMAKDTIMIFQLKPNIIVDKKSSKLNISDSSLLFSPNGKNDFSDSSFSLDDSKSKILFSGKGKSSGISRRNSRLLTGSRILRQSNKKSKPLSSPSSLYSGGGNSSMEGGGGARKEESRNVLLRNTLGNTMPPSILEDSLPPWPPHPHSVLPRMEIDTDASGGGNGMGGLDPSTTYASHDDVSVSFSGLDYTLHLVHSIPFHQFRGSQQPVANICADIIVIDGGDSKHGERLSEVFYWLYVVDSISKQLTVYRVSENYIVYATKIYGCKSIHRVYVPIFGQSSEFSVYNSDCFSMILAEMIENSFLLIMNDQILRFISQHDDSDEYQKICNRLTDHNCFWLPSLFTSPKHASSNSHIESSMLKKVISAVLTFLTSSNLAMDRYDDSKHHCIVEIRHFLNSITLAITPSKMYLGDACGAFLRLLIKCQQILTINCDDIAHHSSYILSLSLLISSAEISRRRDRKEEISSLIIWLIELNDTCKNQGTSLHRLVGDVTNVVDLNIVGGVLVGMDNIDKSIFRFGTGTLRIIELIHLLYEENVLMGSEGIFDKLELKSICRAIEVYVSDTSPDHAMSPVSGLASYYSTLSDELTSLSSKVKATIDSSIFLPCTVLRLSAASASQCPSLVSTLKEAWSQIEALSHECQASDRRIDFLPNSSFLSFVSNFFSLAESTLFSSDMFQRVFIPRTYHTLLFFRCLHDILLQGCIRNGHPINDTLCCYVAAAFLLFASKLRKRTTLDSNSAMFLSHLCLPVRILVESSLLQSREKIQEVSVLLTSFQSTGDISNSLPECINLDPSLESWSGWPVDLLKMIGREDISANTKSTQNNLTLSSYAESSEETDVLLSAFSSVLSTYSDSSMNSLVSTSPVDLDDADGLLFVNKNSWLRFCDDERIKEVCRLLQSSKTLYLRLERAPEATDASHRSKQQARLLALCRRSLALSVGRGMLTMSSMDPLLAEPLPIPGLSLTGRIPPTNATISLDASATPAEFSVWPQFHNGVAAGLRIKVAATTVLTRNWILYNRSNIESASKSQSSEGASSMTQTPEALENGHAGALLAFGLLGHLRVLNKTDICDYLTQGHEPTTIAMLIGLAATNIGNADPLLSKTICLHLPTLLQQSGTSLRGGHDLDVSPLIQTAALAGLGLLHCSTAQRLVVEFLIAEICSQSPSIFSSTATSGDARILDSKESTTLAAGWALGVVMLGRGGDSNAIKNTQHLADLRIEDRLYLCIEGGKRPPDSKLFSGGMDYSADPHSRSSRILEGNNLNVNQTAPGALIALALIYVKSNNLEVAQRVSIPQTSFDLDNIRPDLLIYRSLANSLILWDSVTPSSCWLVSKIPQIILRAIFPTLACSHTNATSSTAASFSTTTARGNALSRKTSFQVLLNILAGHCWALGICYAGTVDVNAKKVLLEILDFLICLRDNSRPTASVMAMWGPTVDGSLLVIDRTSNLMLAASDKSSKHPIETAVCMVAISASMVLAGSGDLDLLRVLRVLRGRVEDVTYGTHLALGTAIGFLFVGQGRCSLKRDLVSIGALVLATCPGYPSCSADNQSHLQAFRHIYVLAVEHRSIHTVDVDSQKSVSVDILVNLRNANGAEDQSTLRLRTPALLPEISTLESISLAPNQNFYYVNKRLTSSQKHFLRDRQDNNILFVKRRNAGLPPSSYISCTSVTHALSSLRDKLCNKAFALSETAIRPTTSSHPYLHKRMIAEILVLLEGINSRPWTCEFDMLYRILKSPFAQWCDICACIDTSSFNSLALSDALSLLKYKLEEQCSEFLRN